MQHLVSEAINDLLDDAKMPNDVTLKALKDAEKGVGVHEAGSPEDLFKILGI